MVLIVLGSLNRRGSSTHRWAARRNSGQSSIYGQENEIRARKAEFGFELEMNMSKAQEQLKSLARLHSVASEDRYQYELR
jgi:hypothetical protein